MVEKSRKFQTVSCHFLYKDFSNKLSKMALFTFKKDEVIVEVVGNTAKPTIVLYFSTKA